jgi:ribonuclease HI
MELTGVIRALVRLERDAPQTPQIDVLTDSVYVIRGITQWIWSWQKNGWKTKEGKEVTNQDLWKKLALLVRGKKIEWKFVRGHAGIPGNERCDEIAVAFSKGRAISLYQGSLLQYGVAIHDLPESFEIPETANRPREPKAPAFSYLSVLNGKVYRDLTWRECEARVKGRPGAKFKKAMNAEDEARILAEWGFSRASVEL